MAPAWSYKLADKGASQWLRSSAAEQAVQTVCLGRASLNLFFKEHTCLKRMVLSHIPSFTHLHHHLWSFVSVFHNLQLVQFYWFSGRNRAASLSSPGAHPNLPGSLWEDCHDFLYMYQMSILQRTGWVWIPEESWLIVTSEDALDSIPFDKKKKVHF